MRLIFGTGGRYRTTLMLKLNVPTEFHSASQSCRYASVARALAISPRSIMSAQPKASRKLRAIFFADCSLPHMNTVCEPETLDATTMISQFTVLSVLITLTLGNTF